MFKLLKATRDGYITNKIVLNRFRAKDANVGKAGTLDLFKLHDESRSGSAANPQELSRLLVKFDLDPLRALTGSVLDYTDSSFNCTLKMRDVVGGQTLPSNFSMMLYPLSKSFDEGIGRDVASFSDVDVANFLTASVTDGVVSLWTTEGADKKGLLGSTNIDVISSGNLGAGVVDLWLTQSFTAGDEDLSMDVTTLVSATLAGQLPDQGFRLSFSGSQETDSETRFVKRFISRHSHAQPHKVPTIEVKYNDSLQDHHNIFYFDLSGSLFFNSFERGQPANIASGSSLTRITGNDSVHLTLNSGSYSFTVSGSQHSVGSNFVTGVYSASFAIPSTDATLLTEIQNAGSATFTEVWGSVDGTVAYSSSSLVILEADRSAFAYASEALHVTLPNSRAEYNSTEQARIRVHAIDHDDDSTIVFRKLPRVRPSKIFTKMHYRVRDAHDSEIVIPFDTTYNSTLLSTDSDGMYFDLHVDSLVVGAVYTFDFLVEGASDTIIKSIGRFRVGA